MQAYSTMRGKRPKIIDVDLLSDISSPKCHSPKSLRVKEEEVNDIEEMQVDAKVEEDVMGLSDAESHEVEEVEGASNVSLGIVRGKKRTPRKKNLSLLLGWVTLLERIFPKKT